MQAALRANRVLAARRVLLHPSTSNTIGRNAFVAHRNAFPVLLQQRTFGATAANFEDAQKYEEAQNAQQKAENNANSGEKKEKSRAEQNEEERAERKEVGNPITWANPVNGPTQEDRMSEKWRWILPGGAMFILFGSLWGRRKRRRDAEKKAAEAAIINTPSWSPSAPPPRF